MLSFQIGAQIAGLIYVVLLLHTYGVAPLAKKIASWFRAEAPRLEHTVEDVIDSAERLFSRQSFLGPSYATVTATVSSGDHTVTLSSEPPSAAPIAGPSVELWPGVVPVELSPTTALAMSATAIQNLGFVKYLRSLTAAQITKWQSDYARAASADALTHTDNRSVGALLYDPLGEGFVNGHPGTMLMCPNSAQVNIDLLYNLGAVNLVTGVPGQ